jgi:hypothetical protein
MNRAHLFVKRSRFTPALTGCDPHTTFPGYSE